VNVEGTEEIPDVPFTFTAKIILILPAKMLKYAKRMRPTTIVVCLKNLLLLGPFLCMGAAMIQQTAHQLQTSS